MVEDEIRLLASRLLPPATHGFCDSPLQRVTDHLESALLSVSRAAYCAAVT